MAGTKKVQVTARELTCPHVFLIKNLLVLKVLFYLFLVGFLYHSLIGVKKVLSDFFGIGEELKSGTIIAWTYNLIFLLVTSFLFLKFFV